MAAAEQAFTALRSNIAADPAFGDNPKLGRDETAAAHAPAASARRTTATTATSRPLGSPLGFVGALLWGPGVQLKPMALSGWCFALVPRDSFCCHVYLEVSVLKM